MRIVAGEYRGRTIAAPDGSGTRPTSDRVREALFSSLYSLRGGFEGCVVLDAFAGSGALGLESLSRGAEAAVFYEANRSAADVLRKNVRSLGIEPSRAVVVARDVLDASPQPAGSSGFDLVFLDPPYDFDCANVLGHVAGMFDGGSLAETALVVYEHALKAKDDVHEAASKLGLEAVTSKKYGKTGVTILKRAEEGGNR